MKKIKYRLSIMHYCTTIVTNIQIYYWWCGWKTLKQTVNDSLNSSIQYRKDVRIVDVQMENIATYIIKELKLKSKNVEFEEHPTIHHRFLNKNFYF